jgi:ankyrin repeat protein
VVMLCGVVWCVCHQPDKSGRTALHWAAISGHREAAELLVEKGESGRQSLRRSPGRRPGLCRLAGRSVGEGRGGLGPGNGRG